MSIHLERGDDGQVSFYINGDLQFDSRDERIYHESLALPPLALAERRKNGFIRALIIGGGDGLTARELLKSKRVTSVDLVDYDFRVLNLAQNEFAALNDGSLFDPRLKTHIDDAWNYVEKAIADGITFDLIVSDLTVPEDAIGARMHSIEWYQMLKKVLSANGTMSINTVSPSATPDAYWCVLHSILSAGLFARPYRIHIPSFAAKGYGLDWGFVLVSNTPISSYEFESHFHLARPRLELTDVQQLRKLFAFPEEFVAYQPSSRPASQASDILLHYFNNAEELIAESGASWNSLDFDFRRVNVPSPDINKYLVPREVRALLSTPVVTPAEEEELLGRVLDLMPALHRFQTRQMVSEFLESPESFLRAIDLQALVSRLLQRASELPQKLVEELQHLSEHVRDFTGDYDGLLRLGMRVLSIVTLVVVVGNLLYPDSVYGKGEHGGGHTSGGAGRGGDRGAGNRAGDRAGDRGFDRGRGLDRGFNRGFNRDWGHRAWWGHYGQWHHWGNWGYWGWARPAYSWAYAPWWGPAYPLGTGYVNLNFGNGQCVDEQGNNYPARTYGLADTSGADITNTGVPMQTSVTQKMTGDYRLNTGADILANGNVAIPLTDTSYMLLTAQATNVVDQTSGQTIVALYNDPALIRQTAMEIRRQRRSLQRAIKKKEASQSQSDSMTFQSGNQQNQDANQAPASPQEIDNLKSTVALLNKSLHSLGQPLTLAPQGAGQGDETPHQGQGQAEREELGPTQPPVPGAIELMSSVWMLQDGKFLVLKLADGSLAYLNNKGWYLDQGVTPLKHPFPRNFKNVSQAFIAKMVKDSDAEKSSMTQDLNDGKQELAALNQDLADYETGPQDSANNGDDDKVDFGHEQIPRSEAIRRTKVQIALTQRRIDAIQSQFNSLPQELAVSQKMLQTLQS
jgi:spermidine synthase